MFTATDYWVVRCPPAKTLVLAEELRALKFDVWTPIAEREYRKARSKKFVRVAEPMLASFIFVAMGDNPLQCAERLDDLRWQHGIRVWRSNGHYAPVRMDELDGLRALEREAATFGLDNLVKGDSFTIGQTGAVNAASFLGLTCTLVGRTRGNLLVLLNGSQNPITIKPSMFLPEQNNLP